MLLAPLRLRFVGTDELDDRNVRRDEKQQLAIPMLSVPFRQFALVMRHAQCPIAALGLPLGLTRLLVCPSNKSQNSCVL